MNIGETVAFEVYARDRWNVTGLVLEMGHEYKFECSGVWFDSKYHTSANGYASPTWFHALNERFLNLPTEKWAALLGTLDRHRQKPFLIGRYSTFKPPYTGELICFSNDTPWMRWTNSGDMSVRVTRIG
jgi:hypothetical protein